MTHDEIKKYVRDTIATGNKTRIQLVLRRYLEWQKEQSVTKNDAIQNALDIFGGKVE